MKTNSIILASLGVALLVSFWIKPEAGRYQIQIHTSAALHAIVRIDTATGRIWQGDANGLKEVPAPPLNADGTAQK